METITGYTINRSQYIEEIGATFTELVHEDTGAQIIHVGNDDPENLFALSFRTYPASSNGVAHILEHTVLCGSKKYPVKDPFFSMTRRSLNTFMNAFTGADFTCYPAASQNEKDFYNLLDVYIDACFYPNLYEESFRQEGHRLEFAKHDDPTSDLQYKGIVFNEMKGAMSSCDSRMWAAISEALLPDTIYAWNSGGDPKVIPELTYEEFLDFHKTYYAPSQCLFFFYGNLPLEKHLEKLEERVFAHAEKKEALPKLKLQPRFTKPVQKKVPYPASESNKAVHTFSFLTTSIEDSETALALQVLDSVLMETDASPLRRAILASGLCTHVDASLDTEMVELPYIIVCKGCEEGTQEALFTVIETELRAIIEKGIDQEALEAAIHQLELSRTEITGDYGPYGLTLFFRSALAKQHGADAMQSMLIHSLFAKLLEKANDPTYFTSLIEKYLLHNPHRADVTLVPDTGLTQEEETEEKKRLAALNLSDEEKDKIVESGKHLAAFQKRKEDISCLPKLDIEDIPKDPVVYPITQTGNVYHHDTFTNQLLYVDALYALPEITKEEVHLLQLLISILTEIGTNNYPYEQFLAKEQRYTGGISTSISLYEQVDGSQTIRPAFIVKGKALEKNATPLFDLMQQVAFETIFTEHARIKELILQISTYLEQKITSSPLQYAIKAAHASFSAPNSIRNEFSGLPYVHYIRGIVANLDKELVPLCEKLQALYRKISGNGPVDFVVTAKDTHSFENALTPLAATGSVPLWDGTFSVDAGKDTAYTIAAPVAFTAMACKTAAQIPELSVASQLFDNITLHTRIREEGGAYGASASYNPMNGSFHFHSYRDPHLERTIKAFKESVDVVTSGDFGDDDMHEAIFSLIQGFDSPASPGSRGMISYTNTRIGRTEAMRKAFREGVVGCNKEAVIHAVQKHLVPALESARIVSMCGKELAEKENVLPLSKA